MRHPHSDILQPEQAGDIQAGLVLKPGEKVDPPGQILGQRAAENGVVNLPLPPVEHIPYTPGGTAAVQLPEEPAAALSAQPQPAKFPGLRAVGQGPARPPAEVGGAAGFVKKAIRQVLEQPPQGGQAFLINLGGDRLQDFQQIIGAHVAASLRRLAVAGHQAEKDLPNGLHTAEIGRNGGTQPGLLPVAAPAKIPVKTLQLPSGVSAQQLENPSHRIGVKLAVAKKIAGVLADADGEALAPGQLSPFQLVLKIPVQKTDPNLTIGSFPFHKIEITALGRVVEILIPLK